MDITQVTSGSFEFATATRIVFGVGRVRELPGISAGLGRRPLVCTGADADRQSSAIASLSGAVDIFPVAGEPTVDLARAAVVAARRHRADVVVAIGGGSALDLAKAAAVLLANGGDPLDYLEVVGRGQPLVEPSVPVVAVPTTAGTGSEVTANAVLASPEHFRKVSLRARSMLPAVALVDPELSVGCSPSVTAASGLDALTQCIEPFVSKLANPVSDALAREGLSRGASGLRTAYRDGADLAARTDMALCSMLGGMALANAKLGAVHGFAGVIGGRIAAAHGAICAALLVPVIAANAAALRTRDPDGPGLRRYHEVARLLTGSSSASVDDGIAWIAGTVAQLRVLSLRDLGVGEDQVDDIVADAESASSTTGNPVVLTRDELRAALHAALDRLA